jgi:hypothetical protein
VLQWNGAGRERDIFARKTQAEHITQPKRFICGQTADIARLGNMHKAWGKRSFS